MKLSFQEKKVLRIIVDNLVDEIDSVGPLDEIEDLEAMHSLLAKLDDLAENKR